VPCGGPVGNAAVSDPGAFVEMNPGGSGGAGPAPGGGVARGISPGGVLVNPYGSCAWCQASLRKPNGPGLLPLPCPYWGFGISGTVGAPTGGGGAGATGASAAAPTGCPGARGAAPGVAGAGVGLVGASGSALACPARASAPRLTAAPASANLTALVVGEVARVR
jgi:hypothetical protein